MAVLTHQLDLVAEPDQRRGELSVVDVGAGSAQQVAVEDEDAHGGKGMPFPRGHLARESARTSNAQVPGNRG